MSNAPQTGWDDLNPQTIWGQVCADLQFKLSQPVFTSWISNNTLVNIKQKNNSTLVGVLSSPSAFHSSYVKKNFSHDLKLALEKITTKKVELQFVVGTPTPPPSARSAPHSDAGGPPTNELTNQPSLTLPQYRPPSSASRAGSPRVEDLFSESTLSSSSQQRLELIARKSGLRSDYKFETFAVSTTNEMAHAAAVAVSDNPGTSYNPLFFYGGVGVGKTHLMHAIGNNILKRNPQLKILYSTGETFTNQIVKAIQNKKAIVFKNKYRTVDVLLMDDIQFVAGKQTVQEEFFHTFNALVQQARQVVLTSDRPPQEINLLENRLQSRFEAGLMIDIGQPTFELRTAILLIKAKSNKLTIPMDMAQRIASRVESARKIEGVVKSLRSEVELKKQVLNLELIEKILKNEPSEQQKKLRVRPGQIIKTTAHHFHLKQAAIKGKKRTKSLVLARHVAMYLMRSELDISLTEVGRHFGNRDHTTVLHATDKITQNLILNPELQQDVSAVTMTLRSISK